MTFPFLFSPDPDLLDRFVAPFRKRKPSARALCDELVVGVVSDEEVIANKGPPITPLHKRMIMVKAVKRVDEVIPDAHYAITEEFMKRLFDEYRIDYIIHGDDPCVLPDGTDAYALAKKAGRYKKIKRTEGVSSTDIERTFDMETLILLLLRMGLSLIGRDNEKRERVVKASRDITMNIKKVIFQVHRLSKDNKEEVLEKAGKDLEAVREQHFARLMKELQGTDFWKLQRAYSPGVQEYVEDATFYKFGMSGTLCTLDEINSTLLPLSDPSLEPLQINILDYILGLADLTRELMRMAIGRISDGEVKFAQKICQFVRQIHRELLLVVTQMDDSYDMKSKMEVMLQSVIKIE
ncbi:hypothetical protein IGI04_031076, partial [Brassica rapa subsp. trilocularis]